MKILVGHNYYQQAGGEDMLFHSQTRMLKDFGHEVCLYERHNDEIRPNIFSRTRHAMSLRWSQRSYDEIRWLIRTFKPRIAHFHNTFFVMTPSVFYACKDEGVPVVVSLHNYRLMCINGLFFRDNKPCEDCLHGSRNAGIRYRCYHGSFLFSAAMTDMISHHWARQTWTKGIDRLIVATEFSRQKHIQAGIPEGKVAVLPHFVEQPAENFGEQSRGKYALYAGRLSEEKGVDVLLRAWKSIKEMPLYIVGTGPQRAAMEEYIKSEGLSNVKMFGFLDRQEYLKILAGARFLIVPCLSYDNFPMVVVEAYSYGVPVLASRLGTLEASVEDGVSGLLFSAGDIQDLAHKARIIISDEQRHRQLCLNARRAYESKYTAQCHHQGLINIYEEAAH
ncbi:MAG: glycosyltransferase [Candidatus Omnitrophica bacterium]|nr:glycosyltransferase [Candidatus Omnitrophota bacterium]